MNKMELYKDRVEYLEQLSESEQRKFLIREIAEEDSSDIIFERKWVRDKNKPIEETTKLLLKLINNEEFLRELFRGYLEKVNSNDYLEESLCIEFEDSPKCFIPFEHIKSYITDIYLEYCYTFDSDEKFNEYFVFKRYLFESLE